MSNQLLNKPLHETPRGLKCKLAAESPLMMIMLNALSKTDSPTIPAGDLIKLRNWDYDSQDAITRGEGYWFFRSRKSSPSAGAVKLATVSH